MAFNFVRPRSPYQAITTTNSRYFYNFTEPTKKPLPVYMIEDGLNWITDSMNILGDAIDGLTYGVVPGLDDPLNNNKFYSSQNTLGAWSFVTNQNIEDGTISGTKITDGSLTSNQFANGSITLNKMYFEQNTFNWNYINVGNGQIPAAKVSAIPWSQIVVPNGSIVDSKIASIAASKIIGGLNVTQGGTNVTYFNNSNALVCTNELGSALLSIANGNTNTVLTGRGGTSLPQFIDPRASSNDQANLSSTKYVTPFVQSSHQSAFKAWIVVTPTSVLNSFGNITATKLGVGLYVINFPNLFNDTNYGYCISLYKTAPVAMALLTKKNQNNVEVTISTFQGNYADPIEFSIGFYD